MKLWLYRDWNGVFVLATEPPVPDEDGDIIGVRQPSSQIRSRLADFCADHFRRYVKATGLRKNQFRKVKSITFEFEEDGK